METWFWDCSSFCHANWYETECDTFGVWWTESFEKLICIELSRASLSSPKNLLKFDCIGQKKPPILMSLLKSLGTDLLFGEFWTIFLAKWTLLLIPPSTLFRFFLGWNWNPTLLFFFGPLNVFPHPIFSSIMPEMKLDIKMLCYHSLERDDQESYLLAWDREAKVAILQWCDMKSNRAPPKQQWGARLTESSVSRKVYLRKTADRKKEPFGEDDGWCTESEKWWRVLSSKTLPREKSQSLTKYASYGSSSSSSRLSRERLKAIAPSPGGRRDCQADLANSQRFLPKEKGERHWPPNHRCVSGSVDSIDRPLWRRSGGWRR